MRRLLIIFVVIAILAIAAPTLAKSPEVQAPELTSAALAKGDVSSYIVFMADSAVLSYDGGIAKFQATSPASGLKIDAASPQVKAYVDYLRSNHDMVLRLAGIGKDAKIHDYTYAVNGFSALLTAEQAEALARQPGITMVMPDEMRYAQTDSSPSFLGLDDPRGPWAKGITGEGVIVGVIDSGIWPEHPSFADDGSYADLGITLEDTPDNPSCNFGNTAHNADDAPFECNDKLLGARQMLATYRALIGADPDEFDSARDDDGHGTHTASTAAGNSSVEASLYGIPRGVISGIAPRARVIAYKGLGNLGGFTSDLAAAIDQAVADGVDVINYSIGGGGSVPTGGDDIAFLFAADAGVFVATSAGNAGPGPDTVGSPGNAPWLTTVGASTQPRFFEGTVVLGDGTTIAGASITPGVGPLPLVDAEFAGGDLCIPGTLDPLVVSGNIVLCRRGSIARAGKSLAVLEAGGAGMIMYENTDDNNLFSDSHWVPSSHIDYTPGMAVKAYIASDPNPSAEIIGEVVSTWASAPSMTYFSSRGPNGPVPDIIKPDVTAPGLQILAGNSPFPDPGTTPPGELFQAIAGTSMSSPHVAGVYALIKQQHPDWSAAVAKSALMTTAYQDVVDNDRVSPADPFDFGAGHINPGGNPLRKNTPFNPGLAYDAGLYEYAAFTCGADLGIFSPGSCDFLIGLGIPTDASDLNLASIGIADLAGSQTVQRTVTMLAKRGTYRVSVEAPPGYTVEVNPSVLRLVNGDTATYYVTITNDGTGEVGEWSFGSLTWTSGGYHVRSPIAVRGALFDAPPEVFSEGADGAASFDVQFGYTGSYAAAPHGLVADAPTSGDIGQDPDQTYPSADDTPVGVQKIDFSISGAAFVRWELVIPGDDDIDLFLENSSGTIIAASTNGGTDELIELTLPADDTYTMVVHGWSVPSAPLPYTLSYWEVPLASGGSLSVDSAPASATIGATETVDVSWSGLTAGTSYLGAVSHTGDIGLMGLTLINVSVP